MADTIDLTPTREGYLASGALFAAQIISDVKRSRVDDDTAILHSLLDIAYSAGMGAGIRLAHDSERLIPEDDIRADREATLDTLLSRCPRGGFRD